MKSIFPGATIQPSWLTTTIAWTLALALPIGHLTLAESASAAGECDASITTSGQFGGGDGSTSTPYLICNHQQLMSIGTNSTTLSKNYRLDADLDLQGVAPAVDGVSRAFITGTFTGAFNGNYKKISNMTISSNTAYSASLFKTLAITATVEKLAFEDPYIRLTLASQNFITAAVVAAYAQGSTIREIWVDGADIGGNIQFGGFIAGDSLQNYGSNTALDSVPADQLRILKLHQIKITNSTLSTDTTVRAYLGGLVSMVGALSINRVFIDSNTRIQTTSVANISDYSAVGGLVSYHSNANLVPPPTSTISQAHVAANVSIYRGNASSKSIGLAGFVGEVYPTVPLAIRDSIFAGSLTWVDATSRSGDMLAGGIIGEIYQAESPVPQTFRNVLMLGNLSGLVQNVEAAFGRFAIPLSQFYFRKDTDFNTNVTNARGGVAQTAAQLRQLSTFSPLPSELDITAITGDGTNVIYTTASAHGLLPRDKVNISGVSPASYNLSNAEIASTTSTTFTVKSSINDAGPTGGKVNSGGWFITGNSISSWELNGVPSLAGANPVWKITDSQTFPALVWPDYWPAGNASAPSNPVVTSSTSSSATLSWTASSVTGNFTSVSGYAIQASQDSGSNWTTVIANAGNVTSATVSNLVSGATYVFRVVPIVSLGESIPSAATTAIQTGAISGAPQNLAAMRLTETSFRISWDPPSNTGGLSITSYTLQVDKGGGFETVAHTGTSAEITGVSINSLWSFRVLATNVVGSSSYAVYTNTPPIPYSGPIVTSFSTREVNADRASSVTLDGMRLSQVTELLIGSTKLSFSRSATNQLIVSLPAMAKGVYDLRMVYTGGGVITHQDAFTVVDAPVAAPSRTLLFTNFAGDGFRLPAAASRGIRSAVSSLGSASKIVCVGSTSGRRANANDQRLALRRAQEACDLAKQLVPGVVTEVRANPASGVGARFRSVSITITGN